MEIYLKMEQVTLFKTVTEIRKTMDVSYYRSSSEVTRTIYLHKSILNWLYFIYFRFEILLNDTGQIFDLLEALLQWTGDGKAGE